MPGTLSTVMILAAILATTSLAIPRTNPSAYVVQVSQQIATKPGQIQPYPRGVSNQILKVQLGTPSSRSTYMQASKPSSGRA